MRLGNCVYGDLICVNGTKTVAKVLTVGSGSVSVQIIGGQQTLWSPQTPVHYWVSPHPPDTPAPLPESKPDNPANKPAKTTEPGTPEATVKRSAVVSDDKPKPAGKDQFGVKVGSAAAAVNLILLEYKKDVTVDMIVTKNKSLIRSNVLSHLKRMAKDGLIKMRTTGEKKEIQYYFSILSPKKKSVDKT